MLPDFAHEFPSVDGDLVAENRSEIWSVGLKPRLGNIATPGRVCPPHNETYDCRIYPNGIGCLRRGGGSGTGRPTGQEPAFRADPTSERNDLPVRANGKPRRAAIPATRRKTRENGKKRDEFPGYCIRPETYRAPGDRIENAAGERDRSIRESSSALRSPRVRKLVRPVSGQYGSDFPGRNAGRICQTLFYTKTQNINEGFIFMKVIETDLEGVVILEPQVFGDRRGYFLESYSRRKFDEAVRPIRFVQDNESKSSYGVLRGLHFQMPPHAQSKLVRVISGTVLDVAVDIRRGSPTFGRHVAVELSGENHRQLFIPRGFAHGFAVLSEEALFQYKCDNYYAPQSEGAVAWNDPRLGIDWRLDPANVILSEKDSRHPRLDEAPELFDYETDYYA